MFLYLQIKNYGFRTDWLGMCIAALLLDISIFGMFLLGIFIIIKIILA